MDLTKTGRRRLSTRMFHGERFCLQIAWCLWDGVQTSGDQRQLLLPVSNN
jgi:hypothetical protein